RVALPPARLARLSRRLTLPARSAQSRSVSSPLSLSWSLHFRCSVRGARTRSVLFWVLAITLLSTQHNSTWTKFVVNLHTCLCFWIASTSPVRCCRILVLPVYIPSVFTKCSNSVHI